MVARLTCILPQHALAILQALETTRDIPGDVCEFGVAHGATSALIANEIAEGPSVLHLFDSFVGLPAPTEKDHLLHDMINLGSMAAYEGKIAYPIDLVETRLKEIAFSPERIVIHAGFFEDTIRDENLPTSVRFAFLDFDLYASTKLVLEWITPHTATGALVIVHDYGYFSSGVQTAVHEVMRGGNWDLQVNPGCFCTMRRR